MAKGGAKLSLAPRAGKGLKVGIAVAAFNRSHTERLLRSSTARLKALGASVHSHWVPGAFELPLAAKIMAESQSFDAIICHGVVIRGETTHYELVSQAAADGILRAGLDSGCPVIFGVLTCEDEAQVLARSSGGSEDAGRQAAEAAVQMALLARRARHGR